MKGAVQLALVSLVAAGCGRPTPVDSSALLEQGRRQMGEGKVAEALATLGKAKDADPLNPESYLLRSQLLEQAGNYKSALDEALAARRVKPADPIAALRVMYLSADYSAPPDLERRAREAGQLAPDNPDAWLFLGNAIARSEDSRRFPEAIKAYEEANRRAPFAATPLLAMGRLYMRMGDRDRGEAMLGHALRMLEQAPPGPMAVPMLTQWLEERRASVFALGQADARSGRKPEARKHLADAALWSRRASELRALKSRATAVPPDSAAARRLALISSRGPMNWPD